MILSVLVIVALVVLTGIWLLLIRRFWQLAAQAELRWLKQLARGVAIGGGVVVLAAGSWVVVALGADRLLLPHAADVIAAALGLAATVVAGGLGVAGIRMSLPGAVEIEKAHRLVATLGSLEGLNDGGRT